MKGAVVYKQDAVGNADDSQSIAWRTSADARPFLDDPSRPNASAPTAVSREPVVLLGWQTARSPHNENIPFHIHSPVCR
jgi:hypothetical protein